MIIPGASRHGNVKRGLGRRLPGHAAGFLLLALLFNLPEGQAMPLLTPLVLFSEVHGTVLNHGVPVPAAEITQQVVWSDKANDVPPRHAISDKDGRFTFAVIERGSAVLRLLPHQPVILQKLIIRYSGVEYMAWRHTKDSYKANSELDGHPLNLVCELSLPPGFEGTHYGICKAV